MRTSQGICVGVFCACAVLVGELHAQPTFQPYGAWRGHIRYVEGPHRTKEKIRWGGGITPTGGAVLVQGFQSAQAVLTDPNVAGALLRQSDAEHRGAFEAQLSELRSTNEQMRTDLNSVLGKLGLEPISALPVNPVIPAGGGTPEGGGPHASGELTPLTAQFKAKGQVLADFKSSVSVFAKRLNEAMAKGRFVLTIPPTDAQKMDIEKRLTLFESVLTSFNVTLAAAEKDRKQEATFDDFMTDANKIVAELKTYSQAIDDYAKLYAELKAKGTLPAGFIADGDIKIQAAKDRVAPWKLKALP